MRIRSCSRGGEYFVFSRIFLLTQLDNWRGERAVTAERVTLSLAASLYYRARVRSLVTSTHNSTAARESL